MGPPTYTPSSMCVDISVIRCACVHAARPPPDHHDARLDEAEGVRLVGVDLHHAGVLHHAALPATASSHVMKPPQQKNHTPRRTPLSPEHTLRRPPLPNPNPLAYTYVNRARKAGCGAPPIKSSTTTTTISVAQSPRPPYYSPLLLPALLLLPPPPQLGVVGELRLLQHQVQGVQPVLPRLPTHTEAHASITIGSAHADLPHPSHAAGHTAASPRCQWHDMTTGFCRHEASARRQYMG
jgi:hypothetical protein